MKSKGLLCVLSVFCVALLLLAGAIQAQVASPRFNPVFTENPINPAAMMWSEFSTVGGGYGTAEIEVESGGSSGTLADGTAIFAQARVVGEQFAVGGEYFKFDLDADTDIFPGGGSFTTDTIGVEGAYKLGDTISIGVGLENEEEEDSVSDESETSTLITVGVSLRIQEVVFLGALVGLDMVEQTSGGVSGDGTRTVIRLGGGYRKRNGALDMRFELYLENAGDASGSNLSVDKEEDLGISVEFVFSDILLGVDIINSESTPPAGGGTSEEDEVSLTVGWVPEEGIAVVGQFIDSETTEPSGDVFTFTALLVGVAWQF